MTAPTVAPKAPHIAIKKVSKYVKFDLNPTNPASGKITSLGIGGNIVSAKDAKNNPK